MLVVAIVAMFAGSSMAAEWDFYGSARIATFYTKVDTIGGNTDSIDQYQQAMQGNSRIGAKVKVSDELTARFEYGTGVNVRILYGEWNFGAGSFLVGQMYSPLNMFYSNQVIGSDNGLLAQGGVYSGREQMLQLKFGGFKIAAVAPKNATTGVAVSATENKIPGLEASYNLKMDVVSMKFAGGYQAYDATVGTTKYDVDSWVAAFGANAKFGAFYVGGNIYMGQNAGNLIGVDDDGANNWGDGYANLTGTAVQDSDAFGAMIAAGFVLNDMFSFEAGYGYVETELDDVAGATNNATNKAQAYYLQSTITLAPGVFFVPEIGKFDGDEDGDTETDYFGIKWQINF